MPINCVLLYVKDLTAMTAFYRDALGLPVAGASPGWVELDAGGVRLGLHEIPAAIAAGIDAGPAREETPFKLIFTADAAQLAVRGVTLIERPWGGADGVDPEGNIFGITPVARPEPPPDRPIHDATKPQSGASN